MLFPDSISLPNQQCPDIHFFDILIKTKLATEEQSMNMNSNEQRLTSKEKRAIYMSRVRGSADSEYRRIERENNARAMRKKRSENPLYREQERRQNRAHMAEMRRQNSGISTKRTSKNRHRMALKRRLISPTSSTTNNDNNNTMINSVYQTLENNLQSSHISFIPYQSNVDDHQQRSTTNKQSTNYEFFQQIDEYCRQQDTGSSSDSNSRSVASTSSY